MQQTSDFSSALAVDERTSPLYAEVWGDTVDLKHLCTAIVIGLGVSITFFFVAKSVLASLVEAAAMVRAYAMLAGLGGCLIGGVICGRLFKPKRKVVEESEDSMWKEEVLIELAAEAGGLGLVSELPTAVSDEMKALGLYDLFAEFERKYFELTSEANSGVGSGSSIARSEAI